MNTFPPTSTLRHFVLAAGDAARAQLFTRWRAVFGEALDVRASASEISAFEGRFAAAISGHFILTGASSSPLALVRPHESLSRAGRDCFAMRLQTAGQVGGVAGATAVAASPGDVMLLDLAQTFSLTFAGSQGAARDVTLWLPRLRLAALAGDEAALHGLVLKAGSPGGAVLGAALDALAEAALEADVVEFDALAEGVVLLAAKAAAPALAALQGASTAAPLATYMTIRRHIDRNLASPALDAEAIAKTFGLSRASLYRLFEPAGGVAAYIRRGRLNRAFQEITTAEFADRRIGLVASRLGFSNVSAFNRAFRGAFGSTPGEARAAARGAYQAPPPPPEAAGEDSLGVWLAALR